MNDKKNLKMDLYYKGTNIGYVNEGKDIKNKFFVGTDKKLEWNFFDGIRFPKRHLLLKRSKDKFVMFLTRGMNVSVKMGEKILSKEELKQRNILDGNKLIIDPSISGQVSLADNWAIAFEYRKPYKKVLTPEQKEAMKLYQRFPKPTKEQKNLRAMSFVALLLVLIIGFAMENYELPVIERSAATFARIGDIPPQRVQETQPTQVADPSTAVQEDEPVDDAPAMPSALGAWGSSRTGTLDESEVMEARQTERVATIVGERIGRRGEPGAGGRPGTGDAAGDGADFQRRTGEVSGGPVWGGSDDIVRRGGRRVDGVGDTDLPILSAGELEGAIARAQQARQGRDVGPVADDRTAIEQLPEAQRTFVEDIRNYIENYWYQIENIIREERTRQQIFGRLNITLYIDEQGEVDAAIIEPQPGSFFTDRFIQRAQSAMMTWRVRGTGELQEYRFRQNILDN